MGADREWDMKNVFFILNYTTKTFIFLKHLYSYYIISKNWKYTMMNGKKKHGKVQEINWKLEKTGIFV